MEVAKKVCQEMLIQRKWNISVKQKSDDEIIGITDSNTHFIVFFLPSPKLNIANVKDCIKIINEQHINHCIIIYNNNITSSAKRVINNFIDATFELFTQNELQFNLTKHCLYSPHELLSETEQEKFIAKMGQDIPILNKMDPVARFYNFPRGSIIKVTRRDNSVSYRIVK